MATNSQAGDGTEDDLEGSDRPDVVQTERNIPFLGLTRYSEADLPEVWGHGDSIKWWAKRRWGDYDEDTDPDDIADHPPEEVVPEVDGFNTVIRDLPRAALAEAAWIHPTTGEVVRTGKHNAVVDPEVAEQMETVTEEEGGFEFDEEYVGSVEEAREEWGDQWREHVIGDDALYQIPRDRYTIVNPMDFLEPLAHVVADRGLEDDIFGEFRLFRAGGKGSADILFNGSNVDVPGRDEDNKPIVVGFQVDWDHFGGTAINAQGMAMNFECINAFRAFTDEVKVKHTGDMDEREFKVGDKYANDWYEVWDILFDLIDEKRDHLADIIADAMSHNLEDILELPDDFAEDYTDERHPRLHALYSFMGLPDYLAEEAARDVHARATEPSNPTWWDVHSGATYAISHHTNADEHSGSEMENQMRIANDALMNPPVIADAVQESYQEARDGRMEGLAEEEAATATIVREEGIERARETYERRQQRMEALAPEMDE